MAKNGYDFWLYISTLVLIFILVVAGSLIYQINTKLNREITALEINETEKFCELEKENLNETCSEEKKLIAETYEKRKCPVCPIQEKTAVLDALVYNWGGNLYNPNEMLFDFWVYNYGDVEAKDIQIVCKLLDINNNIVTRTTYNFGNLASNSAKFGEAFAPRGKISKVEEYIGICYVDSCGNNCDILWKKIPALVELNLK